MEALIHKFSCEADKCFWLQGKFSEGVMDRVGRLEKAAGIFDFHLFLHISPRFVVPARFNLADETVQVVGWLVNG